MTRSFHSPGRSAVYASNGMCATSHPLAAQIAIETLKSGGNAMDAAIAGAVLLGICEPQMTGIGGDCFVLLKPAKSEDVLAFNGSGWAPSAADPDVLRKRGMTAIRKTGVESVTVPAAVDAFCKLSDKWGHIGLDRILAPAIHYADQGVPVAPRVAADWANAVGVLGQNGKRFYSNGGAALKTGEIFHAPEQADVLRRISNEGSRAFYEGEVADDIISTLSTLGGVHTEDDFSTLETFETDPVSSEFSQFELFEHPPNGQGATAI
ncbi:MAG: gamma-glutamyltransferase, partial [Paracoccaceae bacterium]|nr:gamma-glutamyltransferase [Paracoccaceae bacterium]